MSLINKIFFSFNNSGGPGEPAVITLAMEHHRNDDHYLSAVSHDVDLDHGGRYDGALGDLFGETCD